LVVIALAAGVFYALGGMDLLNGTAIAGTREPTATQTPTVTETSTAIVKAEAVVGSESARLRTGPGVTYPALDNIFALRGDRYDIVAQARSLEGTEDWLLVAHPTAGRVWISAVVVDIVPDGVSIPLAVTVPPTVTLTPTPSPTPTVAPTTAPAVRTIPFVGQIAFAGQAYTAGFNTAGFTIVRVTARSSFANDIQIVLLTSSGAEVARNFNTLSVNVQPSQEYQVVVSDPAGGTGNIEFTIELSEA
jgi:hypothetical protein